MVAPSGEGRGSLKRYLGSSNPIDAASATNHTAATALSRVAVSRDDGGGAPRGGVRQENDRSHSRPRASTVLPHEFRATSRRRATRPHPTTATERAREAVLVRLCVWREASRARCGDYMCVCGGTPASRERWGRRRLCVCREPRARASREIWVLVHSLLVPCARRPLRPSRPPRAAASRPPSARHTARTRRTRATP